MVHSLGMHREPEPLPEQPEESAPEPAWDIALLFPTQGSWDEEEYLALSGNRLVELSHGVVEVLPIPTDSHQARVAFLYAALHAFVSARNLGKVRFAPLRLRLRAGTFREPDVLFLSAARDHLRGEQYWSGADLVMEVVSDDDRRRDLVTKRHEYAAAGIDEYWIVDAREQRITVLRRNGERYAEHGSFGRSQEATSACLLGFAVAVSSVLDAA
jgi:Uma2 family endonuclease